MISKAISLIKDSWKRSKLFSAIQKKIDNRFRKRLKNDGFTILCSNCIGGCIYHRLGKQFLTPTINMFMMQPDFIKFLLHLDYYLAEPLQFIASSEPTPVARVGGEKNNVPKITLHFNHAKSPDEAKDFWNRRKTRINKDNLFIILYNLDGITEEQLHLLDNYPCKNKVVLTSSPLQNISWSKFIRRPRFGQYPDSYLGRDFFGRRHYEKKWDFVDFLNK